MTTPEFIAWLDAKMAEQGDGKLVPPPKVIEAELEERLEAKVRSVITERILREAGLEEQVTEALAKIKRPGGTVLVKSVKNMFKHAPGSEWRDRIESIVAEAVAKRNMK